MTGRSIYRRMGIAGAIVAGGVLLSRMLGLVRQIVFADLIGAGSAADEYFVAFLVPDLLNYLLAGAYMAITLIPLLAKRFATGDEADAWRVFWAVTRWLGIGVVALVVIAMPLVEPALRAIEPGFTEPQISNAARLTRIVLPAQIFFVLGQLLTAVQFARERFLIPSMGPVIYNLGIIAGGIIGSRGSDAPTADGFAWGALVGAFVGVFVLQGYGAWKAGLRLPEGSLARHPAVKRYFLLALPLMLGQSLVVLDEQLLRSFGSFVEDGGISWLTFGRQTMLVPVGVVAQAAGVATYPFLARLAAEGKLAEMTQALTRALKYVLVFSLAAAAALIALAQPIVRVLYERGEFNAMDTLATAGTVAFFAIGVPMWGAQQILARGFYAREQMWAPVIIGTTATAVAVPVYLALQNAMGVDGLALASSIAITLYTLALAVVWYARDGWGPAKALAGVTARNLVMAALAGGAGFALTRWLQGLFAPPSFVTSLFIAAVVGVIVLVMSMFPARVWGDLGSTTLGDHLGPDIEG